MDNRSIDDMNIIDERHAFRHVYLEYFRKIEQENQKLKKENQKLKKNIMIFANVIVGNEYCEDPGHLFCQPCGDCTYHDFGNTKETFAKYIRIYMCDSCRTISLTFPHCEDCKSTIDKYVKDEFDPIQCGNNMVCSGGLIVTVTLDL